jgi:hypothetical protein
MIVINVLMMAVKLIVDALIPLLFAMMMMLVLLIAAMLTVDVNMNGEISMMTIYVPSTNVMKMELLLILL